MRTMPSCYTARSYLGRWYVAKDGHDLVVMDSKDEAQKLVRRLNEAYNLKELVVE